LSESRDIHGKHRVPRTGGFGRLIGLKPATSPRPLPRVARVTIFAFCGS